MSASHSVLSQIAQPYAAALFDLAKDANEIDAVEKGLDDLDGLIDNSHDFSRFLDSPTISAEDKRTVIDAILDQAGLPTILANTIRLMARNGRLFALPALITAYKELAAEHRNEVPAEVTSATELSASQREELVSVLHEKLGKSVNLRTRVDESLIGGLIVRVGSKMIDTSIKTKLSAMKIAMKGAS